MAERMENSIQLWSTIIIAFIGSGTIAGIIGFISTRGKNRADAAATLTGSALLIVKQLEKRIEKLEGQMTLQDETIKYLFDGMLVLIEQIEAMGDEPEFRPEPRFRGTNGDEFNFEV